MNLSTFDPDGRRRTPRQVDWPMYAVIFSLIAAPLAMSGLIAWVLDANLSPARIATGLAALAAMTALFALREWCWRIEREERIAYEAELRRTIETERRHRRPRSGRSA